MTETETTTAAATAAIPAATVARRPRHVGNFVRGIGMFVAFTGLMALGLYALKQRVQGTKIETAASDLCCRNPLGIRPVRRPRPEACHALDRRRRLFRVRD
jgi:hypothetical protein